MAEQSKIQWCDSTINFWSGCTMVPAGDGLKDSGCLHCYAKTRDDRQMIEKKSHWGKGAPRLKHVGAVKSALAMNRSPWICNFCGNAISSERLGNCKNPQCKGDAHSIMDSYHRRRIFSLSLGDWLDEEVPIEWLAEMLDTIRKCDQVIWILCTKRPENFHERLKSALWKAEGLEPDDEGDSEDLPATELGDWLHNWFSSHSIPKNIILLASVENQAMADKRIPSLFRIPAISHGLSLEPLLGPVDLNKWIHWDHSKDDDGIKDSSCETDLSWLIIGGESGPNARRCELRWIRSLITQGTTAAIPTFVKQLGGNLSDEDLADCSRFSGKSMHDKKGGEPSEWTADLRIRQFPQL